MNTKNIIIILAALIIGVAALNPGTATYTPTVAEPFLLKWNFISQNQSTLNTTIVAFGSDVGAPSWGTYHRIGELLNGYVQSNQIGDYMMFPIYFSDTSAKTIDIMAYSYDAQGRINVTLNTSTQANQIASFDFYNASIDTNAIRSAQFNPTIGLNIIKLYVAPKNTSSTNNYATIEAVWITDP